jgi:hypothetical protein
MVRYLTFYQSLPDQWVHEPGGCALINGEDLMKFQHFQTLFFCYLIEYEKLGKSHVLTKNSILPAKTNDLAQLRYYG